MENRDETDLAEIVRLDIGGMKFTTTVRTLTQREQDSMLAAMFSGRHSVYKDPQKGTIFIERDGTHFRHILNWLRDGAIPMLDAAGYHELLLEAEYYQLLGLIEAIKAYVNRKKEEDENKYEMTRKDVIKCIQSARLRLRGVNLSCLDLSKLCRICLGWILAMLVCITHFCQEPIFILQSSGHSESFWLLQEAEADESNFQKAILRECEFIGASLQRSLLSGASLQSANMQNAMLKSASLCQADLRSAHLQGADLTDSNLSEANLEGANLKGAILKGANMQGANLQRAYLRSVDLRETDLDGANLEGANLAGTFR